MIAAHRRLAACAQTHLETLDNLRFGLRPASRAIALHRQAAKHRLVVTEHQQMSVRAVTKMIVNALLFTQPLDEVQVTFRVLHTERARRINHGAQLEHVGVRQNAMLFEDGGDDLRHAAPLENPLVAPMRKIGQPRCQGQVVARGALTWVISANRVDMPMQAFVRVAEIQVGGLVEQRLQR
ncbi:hypothetical protein PS720_01720 [Pseudomonas fluorescens]|nr:hypothetical protein PS720_01720 [Pseudomonas fluorescens]